MRKFILPENAWYEKYLRTLYGIFTGVLTSDEFTQRTTSIAVIDSA